MLVGSLAFLARARRAPLVAGGKGPPADSGGAGASPRRDRARRGRGRPACIARLPGRGVRRDCSAATRSPFAAPPRERIAAYFERTGAVDEQLRLLRSRRGWKRATAAFALGDMGSPRAVPALLEALDDPSGDVRAAASRSLGRIGPVEAIEPLVTAGVERRVPRDVAMLALLDVGPSAVPRLLELTQHPEPRVRASSRSSSSDSSARRGTRTMLPGTAPRHGCRGPGRDGGCARTARRGRGEGRPHRARSTTASRRCAWRRPGPSVRSAAGAPSTPCSAWRATDEFEPRRRRSRGGAPRSTRRS